jgi:hypothetical protein
MQPQQWVNQQNSIRRRWKQKQFIQLSCTLGQNMYKLGLATTDMHWWVSDNPKASVSVKWVIRCSKMDPARSLELTADLPLDRRLVGFDGQGDVGSPFDTTAKKSWLVCSASTWISLPSRSIVLSRSFRAARSIDS